MKLSSFELSFFALLVTPWLTFSGGAADSTGRTYYVDSITGSDTNAGLSASKAWKTLARVNQIVFQPGDKILLKAGTRYSGQLKPQGSGKLAAGRPIPIVIDMYGDGAAPRIDAEGRFESALALHNVEYWEVSNLELTNKGPDRAVKRKGVSLRLEDFGAAHHLIVRNLYIHDVNGTTRKDDGASGGIRWECKGKKQKSRYDGLLIENCHIVRCERDGIMGSGHIDRDGDWFPSLNVAIRRNLIEQVPGDGIVPIACDGALVEHNVMRDGTRLLPDGDAAAGIWPWGTDNTVIQFNEVSGHKAPWDAQGFDSDYDCRNTVIQYNYSHDNEGGFLLICNDGGGKKSISVNDGAIVRYNISVNDGLRASGKHAGFSPSFHISGPVTNTKIYNNVIFVPRKPDPKIDRTLIKMDNWGGPWPVNTWFANNIFYVEGETNYIWGGSTTHQFTHNLFFGEHHDGPADAAGLRADPLFVSPVERGPGLEGLKVLMLREGSPSIRTGVLVENNGGRDFWGNPVSQSGPPSIGAHEPVR